MSEENETAFRFRHRAEEIRMMAEDSRDPKVRNVLVSVADDYERMAKILDRIGERENSPPPE